MARVHLIIGPVGAGKTTYAGRLCRECGGVMFNLDRWMARLFGGDARPADGRIAWYVERKGRCVEQIWETATAVLAAGVDVVLELGLVQRDERRAFYARIDQAGHACAVVLLDAPRETRRERILRRNREQGETFSMEVPLVFFELASDMWQPPDADEMRERNIRILSDKGRND